MFSLMIILSLFTIFIVIIYITSYVVKRFCVHTNILLHFALFLNHGSVVATFCVQLWDDIDIFEERIYRKYSDGHRTQNFRPMRYGLFDNK